MVTAFHFRMGIDVLGGIRVKLLVTWQFAKISIESEYINRVGSKPCKSEKLVQHYGNMKTAEPILEEPAEAEILLIALDCGMYALGNKDKFAELRDVAVRMARKRLLYGSGDNDCIGVFKLGSNITKNRLAEDNPPGYEGIECAFPAVRPCIQALRTVRDSSPSGKRVLLLDVLEALGDYLADFNVCVAKRKRVVVFTHKGVVGKTLSDDDRAQFVEVCDLYRTERIQLDIICIDWEDFDEDFDDDLGDVDVNGRSAADFFSFTARKGIHAIWAVARSTGGMLYSAAEASDEADMPIAKQKRPTSRFRGTLDITTDVRIPVKAYLIATETRRDSAVKLSWAESRARGEPVGVYVETQRVASATDDAPLESSQIIKAYAYGTDLVPENDPDDPWSLSLPCGLSTIAFVSQSAVPPHWFMSAVGSVISMPGVPEARRAMDALVHALHDTDKGILARLVPLLRGGAPTMVYLWPILETDRDSGAVKNRYLHMVELPLKQDVRDYPFASLRRMGKDLPDKAKSAMDAFIDSRMMDQIDEEEMAEAEDEDIHPFNPSEHCNPALDRFYISVIQRALDGPEGTDLPQITPWQKKILDPNHFLSEDQKTNSAKCLKELKIVLPISKVPPKERSQKKAVEAALSGEAASIGDFLPPDTEDVLEEDGEVGHGGIDGEEVEEENQLNFSSTSSW